MVRLCTSLHPRSAMEPDTIKQFEREFYLVWKTLDQMLQHLPGSDALRTEVEHASDTLLELMRSADCIDPTVSLDGLSGRHGYALGS
jgi:hypothetical protein